MVIVGQRQKMPSFGAEGTTPGEIELVVAAWSGNGAPLWQRRFTTDPGARVDCAPGAVARLASGTLVWAVAFSGALDLGAVRIQGRATDLDILLVYMDAEGRVQRSKLLGGPGDAYANALIATNDGGVAVAGTFRHRLAVDGNRIETDSTTDRDAFIARFDHQASNVWIRALGGPGPDAAYGLAEAQSNVLCATGAFVDTIDLGAGPLPSRGGQDVFIVCLGVDGAPTLTLTYGGPGADGGASVAVAPESPAADPSLGDGDPSSSANDPSHGERVTAPMVAVAGWFSSRADDRSPITPAATAPARTPGATGVNDDDSRPRAAGAERAPPTTEVISDGDRDWLVLFVDQGGAVVEAQGLGGIGDDRAVAIHLLAPDHAIVLGHYTEHLTIAGRSIAAHGPTGTLIASFRLGLEPSPRRVIEASGAIEVQWMRAQSRDAAWFGGRFTGALQADHGAASATGSWDGFAITTRLDP